MTRKTNGNSVDIKFGLPEKEKIDFKKNCKLFGYNMTQILKDWIYDFNENAEINYKEQIENENLQN